MSERAVRALQPHLPTPVIAVPDPDHLAPPPATDRTRELRPGIEECEDPLGIAPCRHRRSPIHPAHDHRHMHLRSPRQEQVSFPSETFDGGVRRGGAAVGRLRWTRPRHLHPPTGMPRAAGIGCWCPVVKGEVGDRGGVMVLCEGGGSRGRGLGRWRGRSPRRAAGRRARGWPVFGVPAWGQTIGTCGRGSTPRSDVPFSCGRTRLPGRRCGGRHAVDQAALASSSSSSSRRRPWEMTGWQKRSPRARSSSSCSSLRSG